jgi:hypothetical protein
VLEKSYKPPNLDTMGSDELKKQTHLLPQDASAVDASKLTALSPEVVSLTPVVVVEAVGDGHFVSHGFLFVAFLCRFLVKQPSTLVQSDMWHTESPQ